MHFLFFLLARWWQFFREAVKTEADRKYLFPVYCLIKDICWCPTGAQLYPVGTFSVSSRRAWDLTLLAQISQAKAVSCWEPLTLSCLLHNQVSVGGTNKAAWDWQSNGAGLRASLGGRHYVLIQSSLYVPALLAFGTWIQNWQSTVLMLPCLYRCK